MKRIVFIAIAALAGCSSGLRTAEMGAAPRPATAVSASQDAVWAAALGVLVDQSIPIKSSDKAGGIITTEEVGIAAADSKEAGECAKGVGMTSRPGKAQYTIAVTGSAPTSLRVSARLGWYNIYGTRIGDCASTGFLEGRLEQAIRDRASR